MDTNTNKMIGVKYGRLTVLSKGTRVREQSFKWLCKCECGNEKYVRADHLKSGRIVSCGCQRVDSRKKTELKKPDYGIRKHPIYIVWMSMRQRCFNKKSSSYKYYGARGITICNSWSNFRVFYDWALMNGWSNGLQIDRINNNGNYTPDNCRFVEPKINSNNRRSNIIVTLNNSNYTLKQACEILSLNDKLIRQRIRRDGYTFDQAIKL